MSQPSTRPDRSAIVTAINAFGQAAFSMGIATARGGATLPLREQEHRSKLAALLKLLEEADLVQQEKENER